MGNISVCFIPIKVQKNRHISKSLIGYVKIISGNPSMKGLFQCPPLDAGSTTHPSKNIRTPPPQVRNNGDAFLLRRNRNQSSVRMDYPSFSRIIWLFAVIKVYKRHSLLCYGTWFCPETCVKFSFHEDAAGGSNPAQKPCRSGFRPSFRRRFYLRFLILTSRKTVRKRRCLTINCRKNWFFSFNFLFFSKWRSIFAVIETQRVLKDWWGWNEN